MGKEGSYQPNNFQKEIAYHTINSGANVIFGHHTHTIQPIEEYRNGLIAYSLGNFIFGRNRNPRNKKGIILRIYFENKKIIKYEKIPVIITSEENSFQPFIQF